MPRMFALAPGVYRDPGGQIVRMQLARSGRTMYASRWSRMRERWSWQYAPGAERSLTTAMLLPLDDARVISREVGQCLACAAILTGAESQRLGIGPTCAKRWDAARVRAGYIFGASEEEIAEARRRNDAAYANARRAQARVSVRARLDGDDVVIASEYDDAVVGIIRTMPGARWDGAAWRMPREHAAELAEAFDVVGIVHDDLAAIAMGWVA